MLLQLRRTVKYTKLSAYLDDSSTLLGMTGAEVDKQRSMASNIFLARLKRYWQ